MGLAKEYMIEKQFSNFKEKLAEKLGISFEDFCRCEYTIETEESNEGIIYNYIIAFEDNTPSEILMNINELDSNNKVWFAPWEFEPQEYDDELDSIIGSESYYQTFKQELESLKNLNTLELRNQLLIILRKQIFISGIGLIEAFLAEVFINLTIRDKGYMQNYIESSPEFRKEKFEIRDFYKVKDTITDLAKKTMLGVIYHRLDKVKMMYSSTFKIEFPDISELSKFIKIRHDLVHRNGKTKDGENITIDEETISNLFASSEKFIEEIALKLNLIV